MPLVKTTVVIWHEPVDNDVVLGLNFKHLKHEIESFCETTNDNGGFADYSQKSELIEDPQSDPDWNKDITLI